MADEPFALSLIPPEGPAEEDYDALCAAVMQSARGRWFLQEYARRNRHADTERLLAAMERIEALIRDDRAQLADQGMRIGLLDMARAIAQTRAEVAEIKPAVPVTGKEATPIATSDVLAAAERLQDLAWSLRERGIELATCDEIETIAKTVLRGSALHAPSDHRAQKLAEALQYLGRRIDAMLEAGLQVRTAEAVIEADPNSACAATQVESAAHQSDAVEIEPATAVAREASVGVLPAAEDQVLSMRSPQDLAHNAAREPAPADFTLDPWLDGGVSGPSPTVEVLAEADAPVAIADTEDDILIVDTAPVPESAPADASEPASAQAEMAHSGEPQEPSIILTGPRAKPPAGDNNPLAALEAMSDEERIALFT